MLKPQKSTVNQSVVFLGDPQIHNIYGFRLRQMSRIPDFFSKFAIRPPELNILAPLLLENVIKKSEERHQSHFMVVVGDAINIGCSGEYATFLDALHRGNQGKLPVLMAHGNHDSYLLGTVNHYLPADDTSEWKPREMPTSRVPTDESWWGTPRGIHPTHNSDWPGACFEPSVNGESRSSPMNKSRWLAKYIELLKDSGAVVATRDSLLSLDDQEITLLFSARPGSALKQLNFEAKGFWHRPKIGEVPSASDLTKTYQSFIVQKVDYEKNRMVIIDTSVCEKTQGGWRFLFTNTGTNACIGEPQFEIIEQYVSRTPMNHKLVLVGHFPLGHLSPEDKKRLLKIANTRKNWVYVSAHAHSQTTRVDWRTGLEINIGSTTDWPMEANNMRFARGKQAPQVYQTLNDVDKIPPYIPSPYYGKSEICRHFNAAKKLAFLGSYDVNNQWRSPKPDPTCDTASDQRLIQLGVSLAGYVEIIHQRFRADEQYRDAVLSIAAAASQSEALKNDLTGSFRLGRQ